MHVATLECRKIKHVTLVALPGFAKVVYYMSGQFH